VERACERPNRLRLVREVRRAGTKLLLLSYCVQGSGSRRRGEEHEAAGKETMSDQIEITLYSTTAIDSFPSFGAMPTPPPYQQ
jgi:hypothetical protein